MEYWVHCKFYTVTREIIDELYFNNTVKIFCAFEHYEHNSFHSLPPVHSLSQYVSNS